MPSWVWVLIAVAVVAVLAIILWRALAQRRTGKLQEHFGPEYDRTVDVAESKRAGEAELQAREDRSPLARASGTSRSGGRCRRSSSTSPALQ
jgi:membrane protein implicated in regulation of membrane protease activity